MNSPKHTEAGKPSPAQVFDTIYRNKLWHDQPYNSGSGSDPNEAGRPYCEIMPAVLAILNPARVVDIGCGDGRILASLASSLPSIQWTGLDCVQEVIDRNAKAMPHHTWRVNDLASVKAYQGLPQADVYLIKDVMHHWPSQAIGTFIRAIKQTKAPCSLIMTNDRLQGTATDCELGGYRALDGRLDPLQAFQPKLLTTYLHKAIYWLQFCK